MPRPAAAACPPVGWFRYAPPAPGVKERSVIFSNCGAENPAGAKFLNELRHVPAEPEVAAAAEAARQIFSRLGAKPRNDWRRR